MRKQILKYIEKKSKVDLGELAIMLGTDEVTIANEIADMEKENIILREDVQSMDKWPSKDCISVIEDTIIIKLGSEGEK